MSTSSACARSSATTPPLHAMSRPSAAPDTVRSDPWTGRRRHGERHVNARGIAARIAIAALAVAGLALAIVAIGVIRIGGESFAALMVAAGESADHAHQM